MVDFNPVIVGSTVSAVPSLTFLGYLAAVYKSQDKFLYDPDCKYISPAQSQCPNFKEEPIKTPDGETVMTWYAEGQKDKPAILFFHGRMKQLAYFVKPLNFFAEQGYSVLMMEYRGYGNSTGRPCQKNFFNDAALAFDLLKQKGHRTIIDCGYSLGTGVAMGLTQFRNPDAVVLIAPFMSMSQMAQKRLPLGNWVLRDKYRSDAYVQNLGAQTPLLILHGDADKEVPFQQGMNLYQKAATQNKKMVKLEGYSHIKAFFGQASRKAMLDFLHRHHQREC